MGSKNLNPTLYIYIYIYMHVRMYTISEYEWRNIYKTRMQYEEGGIETLKITVF